MARIIDISPPVETGIGVWPGDTEYRLSWVMRQEKGDPVTLAAIMTTPHLGAHADGPLHFLPGSPGVGGLDLEPFLGRCRVVDVTGCRKVDDEAVGEENFAGVERVLFKTGTFPDRKQWNFDFAWFDPEFLQKLVKTGVLLVGIDTPSVDPFDSTDFAAHRILMEAGVRNLEGLDLTGVEAGDYELIALPLPLVEADSSPVRAVLRTLD